MDQIALVENQIDDGTRLLDELAADHFDVLAACWVKPADEGQWFLYIASKVVDDKGPRDAYLELNRTIRRLSGLWVDPFEVKLIGASHPITRQVLALYQRWPAPIPTRYRGSHLGGQAIEEAYIYPPRGTP